MTETTTWRKIPGYTGYEASDDGQISRTRYISGTRRRILKGSRLKSGHILVTIKDDDGNHQRRYIHRLVLTAFVGEPEPGMWAYDYARRGETVKVGALLQALRLVLELQREAVLDAANDVVEAVRQNRSEGGDRG